MATEKVKIGLASNAWGMTDRYVPHAGIPACRYPWGSPNIHPANKQQIPFWLVPLLSQLWRGKHPQGEGLVFILGTCSDVVLGQSQGSHQNRAWGCFQRPSLEDTGLQTARRRWEKLTYRHQTEKNLIKYCPFKRRKLCSIINQTYSNRAQDI